MIFKSNNFLFCNLSNAKILKKVFKDNRSQKQLNLYIKYYNKSILGRINTKYKYNTDRSYSK